jgi:hypothetical protein
MSLTGLPDIMEKQFGRISGINKAVCFRFPPVVSLDQYAMNLKDL